MKIGVTGGIGSGKSHVCSILRKQGYPVYNCDDRAKQLMVETPSVKSALTELIGSEAYTEEGELNKEVIAAFLYANEENRAKVDAIVHPCVKNDFRNWAAVQASDFVFMECALLFESGFNDEVDKVLYIYAREDVRIARVIRRDKITREEAYKRLKAQMPEVVKMKLADFCIINNGNNNIVKQLQEVQI